MKDRLNKILFFAAIISLVVLIFIELLSDYDTFTRQLVLSITNAVVIVFIVALYFILKKKHQITLPFYVAWFAALGVWFDAAGNFAHLYHDILWWDKLAHAVGSAAMALALFVILYQLIKQDKIRLGKFNLSLYTLSLTALVSSIYEVTEYLGDLISESKRVTDLFDTADDLLWNMLAGLFVIILANIVVYSKRKEKKE